MPDHITHIIVGKYLLNTIGLDPSASIYTMIPMLDTKPGYYHRVYDHCLIRSPRITEVAINWFTKQDIESIQGTREYVRLQEEAPVYTESVKKAAEITKDASLVNPSKDYFSGIIAVISHIYIDTFNNPVQPFLPDCCYCSAQYTFWNSIDVWKFREKFYKPENLVGFHQKLNKRLSTNFDKKVNPLAFIWSVMDRFEALTLVPPEEQENLAKCKRKYRSMIYSALIDRYGMEAIKKYSKSTEDMRVTLREEDIKLANNYALYLENVIAQEMKRHLKTIP